MSGLSMIYPLLIQEGARDDKSYENAVKLEQRELLYLFFSNGINPNQVNKDGKPMIFFADSPKVISIFIQYKAELDLFLKELERKVELHKYSITLHQEQLDKAKKSGRIIGYHDLAIDSEKNSINILNECIELVKKLLKKKIGHDF